MTQKQLLRILSEIEPGERIPGINEGKFYYYQGLEKYFGKGRYRELNGRDVAVLGSDVRKGKKFRRTL